MSMLAAPDTITDLPTAADLAVARQCHSGRIYTIRSVRDAWPCEWESCTGSACTEDRRECLQPAEACTHLGADTTPGALSMARHRKTAGNAALVLIAAPAIAAAVGIAAFIAQHWPG